MSHTHQCVLRQLCQWSSPHVPQKVALSFFFEDRIHKLGMTQNSLSLENDPFFSLHILSSPKWPNLRYHLYLWFISYLDLSDPTVLIICSNTLVYKQIDLTYLHKVCHPFSLGYPSRRIVLLWVAINTAVETLFLDRRFLLEKILL